MIEINAMADCVHDGEHARGHADDFVKIDRRIERKKSEKGAYRLEKLQNNIAACVRER